MPAKKRKKIGLALGSGGVKGLAHIGVIKVLHENNIPIDYISGCSIGALVGGLYARDRNVKRMEEISVAYNWKTAFNLFDPTWHGGLIKGRKIGRLIDDWITSREFSELKVPLTVVTTDLITGKEVDICQGNLPRAIRASLAVPPVFRPISVAGRLLSDGGLCNPLPADVVRRMGADVVIGVNLDSGRYNRNGKRDFLTKRRLSLAKVSIRALSIIRFNLAKRSLILCDSTIEPDVPEIGLVGWNRFFDNRQVAELIGAGERAATAALPKLKKLIK